MRLIGRPSVPFPTAFESLAFERPRAEGPEQVPVGAPMQMGVHVATVAMRERSGHNVSIAGQRRSRGYARTASANAVSAAAVTLNGQATPDRRPGRRSRG